MGSRFSLSRREFLAAGLSGAATLIASRDVGAQKLATELYLYVGTYTTGTKSDGIYIFRFDQRTGSLSRLHAVKDVPDPSYLAIGRDGKRLFAVNELVRYGGKETGTLSAFSIDGTSGKLRLIDRRESLGGAPCYVTVTKDGRFVLAANYVGGSVISLPVDRDGKFGEAASLVTRSGSGPNRARQLSSHAHGIVLAPDENFAFVTDLGTDEIAIYSFDPSTGKLAPNGDQPSFRTEAGAGPRHFEFHPDGNLAFLINELDLTITSMRYDAKAGKLEKIETVPVLPRDVSGPENSGADIHVSPDGKFLYGSIRGDNSIVAFRIRTDGTLEHIEHKSTLGLKPRNFAIAPNGRFLLAANQASDDIVVFRIDERTGKLTPVGKTVLVPSPVCLKFLPGN